ncbi:MAG TPA: GTPase HflX [Burkholderiales bacterium]|jgi:GTP-binding protein HflX|nr:GTPase HflX [Burkholderiales bacterium]
MSSEDNHKPKRAVVAAVQKPSVTDLEFEASLIELRQLAKTLGFEVVQRFTQKRAGFDSAGYFGTGKREELKAIVEGGADIVLIDHEISPSQAHNLEKEIGCEVMDRTMVILEIFHRHARSRAARAQVEIARLGYMAPRMREAAKLAGPKDRARSGTGGRSGGESHGELDRRKIRDRIAELQKELDGMKLGRNTQRARRQERQGLARVALVGYTNAGKSTLMRALTGSEVLVADKLFATLDTTVRALHPEGVPRVLVSDTVGFIKNLPHALVVSFKSTLDEALEASLLAHVVDASDPGFERQLAVTAEVLEEIGAKEVPRLLVFNKIDRAGDPAAQVTLEASLRARYPGCIVMSARRAPDVARLSDTIRAFFERDLVEAELFLPWVAQGRRGEIFATCKVVEERADEEGAYLLVRGDPEAVKGLQERFGLVKPDTALK